MADPPDDRPRDEDLFDDLDQFFAPLEESELSEEEEGETGAGEAEGPPARAPAEPSTQPPPTPTPPPAAEPPDLDDLGSLELDLPDDEELLGAGTDADGEAPPVPAAPEGAPPEDVGALDFDLSEELGEDLVFGDEEPAPEGAPAHEAPPVEEPAAGAPAEPASTAEMAGPEWDRMRQEAADEEEAAGPAQPPEGPLSVEDLRSAPPQYADLPGPGDEGPVFADREAAPAAPATPAEGAPAPGDAEPAEVEGLADLEEVAQGAEGAEEPEDARVVRVEEEPEPDRVEAAADHFAPGVRQPPEDVERELLSDLEEERAPDVRSVRIESAAPGEGGPAWEEGGGVAEEEAEEAEAAPAARNVSAALASGVLLGAAVLALLAIGKGPFVVLAAAVILLAQSEFYMVMRLRRMRPATLLGLACGLIIVAGAYLRGEGALAFGLTLAMLLTVLWFMAAPQKARAGLTANAAVTIVGVAYVPFLAGHAMLLLALPGDAGRNIFLVVVALTVLYDVCAYAIGSLWGSRPLAPTISPRKSLEGAIGATLVVLLVALAIVTSISPFDAASAVGLALVIAVAAPLGDLVESAFKRDLKVKDMSSLLPGHGGLLDRIDAILFTAPAAWYFLRIALS